MPQQSLLSAEIASTSKERWSRNDGSEYQCPIVYPKLAT
jgi:hypothetical protein